MKIVRQNSLVILWHIFKNTVVSAFAVVGLVATIVGVAVFDSPVGSFERGIAGMLIRENNVSLVALGKEVEQRNAKLISIQHKQPPQVNKAPRIVFNPPLTVVCHQETYMDAVRNRLKMTGDFYRRLYEKATG